MTSEAWGPNSVPVRTNKVVAQTRKCSGPCYMKLEPRVSKALIKLQGAQTMSDNNSNKLTDKSDAESER